MKKNALTILAVLLGFAASAKAGTMSSSLSALNVTVNVSTINAPNGCFGDSCSVPSGYVLVSSGPLIAQSSSTSSGAIVQAWYDAANTLLGSVVNSGLFSWVGSFTASGTITASSAAIQGLTFNTVDGKVGIETASPDAALKVGGSAVVSGGSAPAWGIANSSPTLAIDGGGVPGGYYIYGPGYSANNRVWGVNNRSGRYTIEAWDDGFTAIGNLLSAGRSGTTITDLSITPPVTVGSAASPSSMTVVGKLLVSSGTAVMKFASITLADDGTYALETDFGTSGVLTIASNEQINCGFTIRGSANTATNTYEDSATVCDVADTDGQLDIIADGDSTYTLKNRRGATYTFAIQFIGF